MSIKALTHSSVQSAAHQADRTTSRAECSLWTGRWTLWFTSIYILLFRQKLAGIHFWTFVPRPADGRFCLAGILKSSWTTNISKLRLLLLNSHRNTSMTEGMSLIYWHQFYTHCMYSLQIKVFYHKGRCTKSLISGYFMTDYSWCMWF